MSGRASAKADLERLLKIRPFILSQFAEGSDLPELAGSAHVHLSPAAIAGLISRETDGHWKYCIPPTKGGSLGDSGHGCGPGQIDDRSFPDLCRRWREGKADLNEMVHASCLVLIGKVKTLRRLAKNLPEAQVFQAALAAYNCGELRVLQCLKTGLPVDHFTAGHNYSADTLERIAFYEEIGFGETSPNEAPHA